MISTTALESVESLERKNTLWDIFSFLNLLGVTG